MQTGLVELVIAFLGLAGIAAVLIHAMNQKKAVGREKRNASAVSAVIVEYFRRSGVDVSVNSVSLTHDRNFTVFIESEPMKRFRLSHIIEATLREQVEKACGLELDKVYWRFPIKDADRNAAEAAVATTVTKAKAAADAPSQESKPAVESDDYINEGLVHYKHLPKVEVTELSWENFEEASTTVASEKKSDNGTA